MSKKNQTHITYETFIDFFRRWIKSRNKTQLWIFITISLIPIVNWGYWMMLKLIFDIERREYKWDLIPSKQNAQLKKSHLTR